MNDRRIIFVHAHPDDESIETGATMAKYAAEGASVCLVTCTLGEEGDVIPAELRHLTADGDRLGRHRAQELARACKTLGVDDHRYLGGAGRWRDSGMAGAPANQASRCFWNADVDEAAIELVRIVREIRPQVIVTYDANGFYGHPDHIQAHRVALRAFQMSDDMSFGEGRPWRPTRFYVTAIPLSVLAKEVGRGPFDQVGSVEEFGFGVPDEQVTTRIEAGSYLSAKVAALQAHHSQLKVDPDASYCALSDNVGQPIFGTEYYFLLVGVLNAVGPDGLEGDLFGEW